MNTFTVVNVIKSRAIKLKTYAKNFIGIIYEKCSLFVSMTHKAKPANRKAIAKGRIEKRTASMSVVAARELYELQIYRDIQKNAAARPAETPSAFVPTRNSKRSSIAALRASALASIAAEKANAAIAAPIIAPTPVVSCRAIKLAAQSQRIDAKMVTRSVAAAVSKENAISAAAPLAIEAAPQPLPTAMVTSDERNAAAAAPVFKTEPANAADGDAADGDAADAAKNAAPKAASMKRKAVDGPKDNAKVFIASVAKTSANAEPAPKKRDAATATTFKNKTLARASVRDSAMAATSPTPFAMNRNNKRGKRQKIMHQYTIDWTYFNKDGKFLSNFEKYLVNVLKVNGKHTYLKRSQMKMFISSDKFFAKKLLKSIIKEFLERNHLRACIHEENKYYELRPFNQ